MQFEEDEARVSDEDPEFTGSALADDADDEFLADDVPLVVDDDLDDDADDDDDDLAADL